MIVQIEKQNKTLKGLEERGKNLKETAWPASLDNNLKKKYLYRQQQSKVASFKKGSKGPWWRSG